MNDPINIGFYRRELEGELRKALARLRAIEAEWADLAYAPNDPRGRIPDNEMPQEWIDARDICRRCVVYAAARSAGEAQAVANLYADTPLAEENPYSIDRARMAVAVTGRW